MNKIILPRTTRTNTNKRKISDKMFVVFVWFVVKFLLKVFYATNIQCSEIVIYCLRSAYLLD